MKPLYFDYSATTPVDPRVAAKMIPFLTEEFGNPASRSHPFGWTADKAVEVHRGIEGVAMEEVVLRILGGDEAEATIGDDLLDALFDVFHYDSPPTSIFDQGDASLM